MTSLTSFVLSKKLFQLEVSVDFFYIFFQ